MFVFKVAKIRFYFVIITDFDYIIAQIRSYNRIFSLLLIELMVKLQMPYFTFKKTYSIYNNSFYLLKDLMFNSKH